MGLFDKFINNKVLTPQERRNNTIEQLKKAGIATNPHLPLLEPGEQVTLKSTEEIEKRGETIRYAGSILLLSLGL